MLSRLIRITLASVFVTAIAGYGVAFAQEDPCGGGGDAAADPCGGGDAAAADPCGGGDAAADPCGGDAAAAPAADAGDHGGWAWSGNVVNRPLTLDKGAKAAGAIIGSTHDFKAISAIVGGAMGVNDKLTVEVGYSLAVEPFEAKGDLGVAAIYEIKRDDKMIIAGELGLGYSVLGEAMSPIEFGVAVKRLINDKLAIETGVAASLNTEADNAMGVAIPLTAIYQVNDKIAAMVNTTLVSHQLKPSGQDPVFVGDPLSLALGANFAVDDNTDAQLVLVWADLVEAAAEPMIMLGFEKRM
jgi:hypothetical protein